MKWNIFLHIPTLDVSFNHRSGMTVKKSKDFNNSCSHSSSKLKHFNIDKPESKSQVQSQSQIEKGKRNLDSGLSLKSHGPPPPPHPQLLSMKKACNKKTQRVKVTQYDPLYLLSSGGQQEGEHRWVQHVQGEHYEQKILRLFVIVSGPVGNPELSHPQSIEEVQSP